jgi:hypothetical protein
MAKSKASIFYQKPESYEYFSLHQTHDHHGCLSLARHMEVNPQTREHDESQCSYRRGYRQLRPLVA